MESELSLVNYDFWNLTADRMLKLDTGSSNTDAETFDFDRLDLETKDLKQNAALLKQHAKILNPEPERLTNPKRLNKDAENVNIVADNLKLNVRTLILDARH